ncbi:MAG: heliorhodopsin HeR [Nitriliruptoraceae bacterium]
MADTHAPNRSARYRRLRVTNLVVGLVHLVQGVALFVLRGDDVRLPVSVAFLGDDPLAVTAPATPTIAFHLVVGALTAVFVLFAAADHLLTAGPLRGWYESMLDRQANIARWIEYSVSSSIMIVLIVALVGIRDLAAIVALFAINSAMILFGLVMERRESIADPDMTAFWSGTASGFVPWLLIAYYVASTDNVPTFVYAITVVQFVLFWSFGANMWLQYRKKGPWRDYLFAEYAFIILSLAAKTLLAWLVYANVLTADARVPGG